MGKLVTMLLKKEHTGVKPSKGQLDALLDSALDDVAEITAADSAARSSLSKTLAKINPVAR